MMNFLCACVSCLQSGYFSSMFSGSWKESNMMVIQLEIPDQNIDAEGVCRRNKTKDVACVIFTQALSVLNQEAGLCVCVFVCVALQVVFGSLYRDDVLIKPSRVVSILAAACMLQLVSALYFNVKLR